MILRSKTAIFLTLALVVTIILPSLSNAQTERKVAVVYFLDHSKFDRGSGCGFISLGPLNSLFGIGQKKEKWELASGFRDKLNENLKNSGYNVIEQSYVEDVIKDSGKDNLAGLASKLGADVLIVGDITKFEQHRTRISSSGPTSASANTGADMSMAMNLKGGIGGYYYASSVKTTVTLYDNSGDEIDRADIESKKDLKDFTIGMGPFIKSYQGGESNKKDDSKEKEPIVEYQKLDKMKFGTDVFMNQTLFGLATTDVMNQIVAKVGDHIEPTLKIKPGVEGKIIYVGDNNHLKENEAFIDLGAADGLAIDNKLGVYIEELTLTDPDTGKELKKIPEKKVGLIKVSKIEADHLSVAEIVEGLGEVKKGNIIRPE
jgi:hypothetical protein